jgi:hypothetical protein
VQLKVQIGSNGSGLLSYWRGKSNTGKSLTLSAGNNKAVHKGMNPLYIVVYLLKARTVEPEKLPLLDYARTQQQRNCQDTRCDVHSRCYETIE